jgi:hypothetical protein
LPDRFWSRSRSPRQRPVVPIPRLSPQLPGVLKHRSSRSPAPPFLKRPGATVNNRPGPERQPFVVASLRLTVRFALGEGETKTLDLKLNSLR